MRFALFAAILVCALPVHAEGLDEAYVKPDQHSTVDRLLHRAGFAEIQKSFALVIGVHDFDDFEPLPTAQDPISMRDYLVNEAGFDHVHLLTGDKVTKERLEELMLDVFGELVTDSDRFLFYWSGHGHTIGSQQRARGFLPVKDSDPSKRSSMVSMENIRFWDSYIQAHQVLYLMDACYSGLIGAAPQSDLARITRAQLSGPSRHVITAGNRDEQTIAIDQLGGSIFTHALLKGLRGEADSGNVRGKDGLVTVGELRKYLGEEITELREYYGWERGITPQIRDMRGSEGAFFFPVPAAFPLEPAPPAPPEADTQISQVQKALQDLGYDPGPVTGEMSLKTRSALIAFQRQTGLVETGKLDAETLDAIPFALAALVQPQGDGVTGTPPKEEDEPEEATAKPTKSCEKCPELVRVKGTEDIRRPFAPVPDFYIATTEITIEQYVHYLEDIGVEKPLAGRQCYDWTPDGRMRKDPETIFASGWRDPAADSANSRWVYDWYTERNSTAACVSRNDVEGYIRWLNEKEEGSPYRLPTEGEYQILLERQFERYEGTEVAQVGFTGGTFEEARSCRIGNFGDASSQFDWRNRTCEDGFPSVAPAGSFDPDENGIFDLAGNLWEWAGECWRDAMASPPRVDNCQTGTVRGGSFDDPVKNATPDVRQPVPANRRQTNIGFRVARDLE